MATRRAFGWLLFLIVGVDSAAAGTGQVLVLPLPRVKVRSGITLAIDTRWVSGNGYRPVRVRVAPITGGIAPADRYFDVTIQAHGTYPGSFVNTATGTVHLPQGAAFGETVIDIPQTTSWGSYDIETREDGDLLRDLTVDNSTSRMFYYDQRDVTPSILLVHRMAPDWRMPTRGPSYTGLPNTSLIVKPVLAPVASGISSLPVLSPAVAPVNQPGMGQELRLLPDIRVMAGCFPSNQYYGYGGRVTADRLVATAPISDAETMRLVNEIPWLDMLPPSALPDRWLSYSGIDVLITSLEDLELLAAESPTKWEALCQWLSTGPMLCVYGVGANFEQLPKLTELLRMPPSDTIEKDALHGWSRANPNQYRNEIRAVEAAVGSVTMMRQQTAAAPNPSTSTATPTAKPNPPSGTPFVTRDLGRAQIVAIADANPFPGTDFQWSWIFNTVPSRNWLWYQRHGISNQSDNEHFWNFLIPGIGGAPVLSFLTLITLFAVVVGPVNYYFLHRRGRLYLLLVTVPLGAIVVTTGLFLYAMVADGLGVRARVRSLTEIDQRTSTSMSWSRQTYYAGLAPSEGLVYPADSAVYPVDHRPTSRFGIEDASREVVWGERQHLAKGYFLSRTISQVMVVEPRKTTAGLRVTEAAGDEPPQVINELGVSLEKLLLCDARGRHFVGGSVGKGATEVLRTADLAGESSAWRSILGKHRPTYPEGFNPAQLENVSGVIGSGFRFQSGMPSPSVETSLMESSLREALANDFRWMKPKSYLALVPRPPQVSLGVESANEVAGFHVIVGRW